MQPDAAARSAHATVVLVRIVQRQRADSVQLFHLLVVQPAGDVVDAQRRAQITFHLFVKTRPTNGRIETANQLQAAGLLLEHVDP